MTSVSKLLLCALALSILAAPSMAAERERSGSFQGREGASGTFEKKMNRDRETKSWTGNRTTTTAEGKTATIQRQGQKTDTGYQANATRTGYNGNTQTIDKSVTKTESGYAVDKTVTGQNGNIYNATKDVTKTDTGWSANGTYNTSTGHSGTVTQSGGKTADGYAVKTQTTNDAGQGWTRDTFYNRDGSTVKRDVTQTGPQGNTKTWGGSATFNR